jgi:uncharacterized membrane protein
MLRFLRVILLFDGMVLCVLGLVLLIAPHATWTMFGFSGLPGAVNYIVGLLGAFMLTMGLGYFLAARDPAHSAPWVIAGIIRGLLEAAVSLGYTASGIVTFNQAWLGLLLAAWFAVAYIIFYPRRAWITGASGNHSR